MRNHDLIKRRDKKLVDTFHNLYDVKRKRLDDAIKETADLFFLNETYVYKRIFYTSHNKEYYEQLTASETK